MYKLVISDDEGNTTVIPLLRDEITIGRKEGNTIRLTERNISRQHARIARRSEKLFISDQGSYNGTFLSGEKIDAEKEINIGDNLTIGDYSLSLHSDEAGEDTTIGEQSKSIGRTSKYARLVVLGPITSGREFDLDGYTYTIGRLGEANIDLEDGSVSPQHARLEQTDKKWTITDLDSAAGVMINKEKISEPQLLKAGDIVHIGDVEVRFVAPGEPFTYREEKEEEKEEEAEPVAAAAVKSVSSIPATAPGKQQPSWSTAALTAAVIVLVAVGGFMIFKSRSTPRAVETQKTEPGKAPDHAVAAKPEKATRQDIDSMIESAKDKMQEESWRGAVDILGKVLQSNPGHGVARDLKVRATQELENQKLFNRGLEASSNEEWEEAYRSFIKISADSQYNNEEQLMMAKARVFDLWASGAGSAIDNGDRDTAKVHISALKEINDLDDDQKRTLARLERRLVSRKQDAVAVSPEPGKKRPATSPSPVKKKRPASAPPPIATDPYSGAESETPPPAASVQQPARKASPVEVARERLLANDQMGAIAILEKGGNSKPVLNLLAATYMAVKDRQGYIRTIKKYVGLYPDDRKSEQYKKVLDNM